MPERTRRRQGRVGVLSAGALLAFLAVGAWLGRLMAYDPSPDPTVRRELLPPFEKVPMEIGEWRGRPQPIKDSIWEQMGVDAALSRVYEAGDHEVRLLVEARVGKSRDGFHLPMVCMTAHGWSILETGVEAIRPEGMVKPIDTTWLLMTQAGEYMVVRYWLWNGDGYVSAPSTFWRQANAVAAWERLHNANPKGALFLAYTPVEQPDGLEAAMEAQADLADRLLPSIEAVLKETVPKAQEHERGGRPGG